MRLPRKVTIMPENVHATTTRAQSRQAPAPAHQILRACAVEMHFEDFERHERISRTPRCNTSIRFRCLTPTVRTPRASTLLGERPSHPKALTEEHKYARLESMCAAGMVGLICFDMYGRNGYDLIIWKKPHCMPLTCAGVALLSGI